MAHRRSYSVRSSSVMCGITSITMWASGRRAKYECKSSMRACAAVFCLRAAGAQRCRGFEFGTRCLEGGGLFSPGEGASVTVGPGVGVGPELEVSVQQQGDDFDAQFGFGHAGVSLRDGVGGDVFNAPEKPRFG